MADLPDVRRAKARWPFWRNEQARGYARTLEKEDLSLVHTLLAIWALDLAGLAAFLHNRLAADCLWAAVGSAAAAGLFLEVRHRWQDKRAIAWTVVAALLLGHSGFLAGAAWVLLAPGHTFAVEKYALYQVDAFPDGTPRFAAVSDPLPDGQVFVSPIDALLLLQMRNMSAEPRHIQSYKVDGWIGGAWEPLCRVRFSPNAPYYLSARSSAREVILTPLALGGDADAVAPGASKIFWSGWACARKCDLTNTRLRITVTDGNARKEVIAFPSQGASAAFDMPSGLGIGGALNLDPLREEIYPRGVCTHARRRHADALW